MQKSSIRTATPKINKRLASIQGMPKGNFAEWLVASMKRRGIPIEKKRVQEYVHIYKRTRQLAPQMVDFVETIFDRRKKRKLYRQLVFLGRGARPFYRIAFRLAERHGVPVESIKLVEAGRRLSGKVYEKPATRKLLLKYLQSLGVDIKKSISFIDTGVIGTVPKDFIQLFKLEGLSTKVNGYMFYGRNVKFKDIGQYSPSSKVNWIIPHLSEREARAVLEDLPKSMTTVKELVRHGKKVRPKYSKEEPEEILGAQVTRRAIMDSLKELGKI
jgi:hypothetical protein